MSARRRGKGTKTGEKGKTGGRTRAGVKKIPTGIQLLQNPTFESESVC
jgi:hypothetical protein